MANSVQEVEALVHRAFRDHRDSITIDHLPSDDGRRAVARRVRWTCSGNCARPVPVEIFARGGKSMLGTTHKNYEVTLYTRCRVCDPCRRARRHEWTGRAVREAAASSRTWLGTLTLTPDNHYRALARARERYSEFDAQPPKHRFTALAGYMGDYVTLWLKRVRENSHAPLRYLAVAEPHSDKLDGFPHFHVLIHEQDAGLPVRQKVMSTAWQWGFSSFSLLDDPMKAGYPCKYLMKDASTRVRASFRYGLSSQKDDDVSQTHSHLLMACRERSRTPTPRPKDAEGPETAEFPETGVMD